MKPIYLICLMTPLFLSGCVRSGVSDVAVAEATREDRRICAERLAGDDFTAARRDCLVALVRLRAGFGED